jgi:hypothetical protein
LRCSAVEDPGPTLREELLSQGIGSLLRGEYVGVSFTEEVVAVPQDDDINTIHHDIRHHAQVADEEVLPFANPPDFSRATVLHAVVAPS